MRARLLDMGEVGAVRSRSICHAIAGSMHPGDASVAVLLRPASSLVSIGIEREPTEEIDLERCLQERIPVLHSHFGGAAELIGDNRLLFDFLLPQWLEDTPAPTAAPLPRNAISVLLLVQQPHLAGYGKPSAIRIA